MIRKRDDNQESSVGVVETSYYTFGGPDSRMMLESGEVLGPITLAYETYGRLNKDKSNAILVCHALSGDAHTAGVHEGQNNPGWWDEMIGPGKAFDTDKYFVICSNVVGGCKGSTGPASINPASGKPYGLDFPFITISDMVNAQKHLIDSLGIKTLLSVAGGSMGGMQVLQWIASYPDFIRSAVPVATTLKHSPQQIAFNEVARQAIMADPTWRDGNYYEYGQPEKGLAVARMIGHITFMSDQSMEEKFSRRLKKGRLNFNFDPEFEVEGYLHYRGANFVKRFDANSYIYLTKALDYFDLSDGKLIPQGKRLDARIMVISFKSDWLYPSSQSQEIVRLLKQRHVNATYCDLNSTYGHDAFLVEIDEETTLIKHFLEKTYGDLMEKGNHDIK
jgi:homoserine O-acetyltransferase/O-succinyltransferase